MCSRIRQETGTQKNTRLVRARRIARLIWKFVGCVWGWWWEELGALCCCGKDCSAGLRREHTNHYKREKRRRYTTHWNCTCSVASTIHVKLAPQCIQNLLCNNSMTHFAAKPIFEEGIWLVLVWYLPSIWSSLFLKKNKNNNKLCVFDCLRVWYGCVCVCVWRRLDGWQHNKLWHYVDMTAGVLSAFQCGIAGKVKWQRTESQGWTTLKVSSKT